MYHTSVRNPDNQTRIVAGTVLLSRPKFIYDSAKQIPHPDWNPGVNLNNDIGLIQLTTAINFSKTVKPISLPAKGEQFEGNVIVSGWGASTANFTFPDHLKAAKISILDGRCNYGHNYESKLQICAGVTKGAKGACDGDSGGPLIKLAGGGKEATVIGIVSYGGGGCGDPVVFTKVSAYTDWIDLNREK